MHTFYLNSSNTACHRLFISASWSIGDTIYCSFDCFLFHRCFLIHRLHHPSFARLLPDPSLAPSIAPWSSLEPSIVPSVAPWSIRGIIHRFFGCFLIHRWYHLRLLPVPSHLQLLSDSTLTTSTWSIGGIIHCFFDCFLIHRWYNLLLLWLLSLIHIWRCRRRG